MKTANHSLLSAHWLTTPLLAVALLLSGAPAHSQASPKHAKHAGHTAKSGADYCTMKDGKMTMMKGGKAMPMMADMTMSDGSMCMTDGTCKMKDGTTMKLKEGECMMMNGRMTMHPGSTKRPAMTPGNKMGNMKM